MEEDQKMKHVCKLCNKRYPCGRSLGGHMRSHVIVNSAEEEIEANPNTEKVSTLDDGAKSLKESGVEANEQPGYGLRQNPKKTWRLVDSGNALEELKVCKECGKGFQSLKALCGHMACHSEKERTLNNTEDHSWTSANQKLVMDSQSDTEVAAPRRRRRSKRMRYKTLVANSPSLAVANGSSSVSEIEQEQEEVAMCLMMLSRDSGNWGALNSVASSSDNNSVVLEARSLSIDMKISKKQGPNCACNGDETVEMKLLKLRVSGADLGRLENSGSKLVRNGVKRVESDASVAGFLKSDEFRKLTAGDGSGFEVSDTELGKDTLKCTRTELVRDLIKEDGYGDGQAGEALMKCDSRKRARNDSCSPELWEVSCKKIANGSSSVEVCNNAQKTNKFVCLTCKKVFYSYQAYGGHIASHKKINGCFASTYESGENSIETEISPDPMLNSKLIDFCSKKSLIDQKLSGNAEKRCVSKKGKWHECPICFKAFRSGQALGGHKRIHMVGGSGDKGNQMPVIKQELPEIPALFDLNLPASADD